ncbi:PIN domain-containing protein [uncultured Sphingomonas sp.]|uniref:PIN domain-containing protein n=1 Tax=uncultured Sphingomonas sp. TaxID=158754 RepID=UPI0035C98DEC
MAFLIDTNVAIHLRDGDEPFVSWAATQTEPINLSLISVVELQAGLVASEPLLRNRLRGYDDLLSFVMVLPLDRPIVDTYGRIIRAAGFSRPRLLDRLIAATAIVHELTLVTINGSDFRDIPGLKLEVWPAAQ